MQLLGKHSLTDIFTAWPDLFWTRIIRLGWAWAKNGSSFRLIIRLCINTGKQTDNNKKRVSDFFIITSRITDRIDDTNLPIIINFKQNQENIPTKRSLFRVCKIYMNVFFSIYRGVLRPQEELTRQRLLFWCFVIGLLSAWSHSWIWLN